MTNSLLVRDFTKVYRELRYTNEGSIRLSEIEHNAYLNRLTLEITHYDAYRSVSYKTNPDNTHWGYLTSLKGSSVWQNLPIKFAKQRVYEQINQGIWDYHQMTETTELHRAFVEQGANAIVQSGVLESAVDKIIELFLEARQFTEGQINNASNWLFGYRYGSDAASEVLVNTYTSFPIGSPFPDVWKFKSDIPVSFLFRLETWYLVNPAVYILGNPTDTGDETEGEDEYPEPEQGDGLGGQPSNFPAESPADPDSDPNDYGGPVGGGDPGELDPQTAYNWRGDGTATILGGDGQQTQSGVFVEFTSIANGAPFTVSNGPTVLYTQTATTYYSGLVVKDRFGQVVLSKYVGVGFIAGSIPMNISPVTAP